MKNRSFRQSFKNAKNGVMYTLNNERNMRFHFILAFIVVMLGIFLKVPKIEFALLIISIGFVIVCELFNSSIETLVDMVVPVYHPTVKKVKDIAAAAVMLSAIVSLFVGYFVFWDRVMCLAKELIFK